MYVIKLEIANKWFISNIFIIFIVYYILFIILISLSRNRHT